MAARRARFMSLVASLVPLLAMAAPGDPTEEEMVRALAPRPAQAVPAPGSRPSVPADDDEAMPAREETPGLRLRGRKAVTAKAAKDATEGAREGRLQLSVQFDLGSAVIAEEGRALLARLGRAMASPELAGLAYRIEGHTDATGGPAINQRLSERRAESVTAFLIAATGLSEDRFVPVGFGSSQPLDPANPEAAVNRRVVVVSLERAGGIVAPVAAAPRPAPSPKPAQAAPAAPAATSPAAAVATAPSAPSAAITLGEGGRLQHVKGQLEIQKASGAGRTEVGARVEEGDVLTTGPGASALVQFDDGANVLIRPDSSVKLAKLKHSGDSLGQLVQVITGACRYVTGSVGRARPETVALSTPTATVGIRGTDLEVVYQESAAGGASGTYVKVNDGGVTVGGIDGTKVDLARGEKAFAGKPGRTVRGQPAGPAVIRVTDAPGVFAEGDLDALLERR
jgi:outer membrane protein OmpA-like peptidoglycan-associated protein